MKQYDKIWVPEKRQGKEFRDVEGDTPSFIPGPVIVVTIEELNDVFKAGHRYADWRYDKGEFANISGSEWPPKFNEYLQSKGINTND